MAIALFAAVLLSGVSAPTMAIAKYFLASSPLPIKSSTLPAAISAGIEVGVSFRVWRYRANACSGFPSRINCCPCLTNSGGCGGPGAWANTKTKELQQRNNAKTIASEAFIADDYNRDPLVAPCGSGALPRLNGAEPRSHTSTPWFTQTEKSKITF